MPFSTSARTERQARLAALADALLEKKKKSSDVSCKPNSSSVHVTASRSDVAWKEHSVSICYEH